MNYNSIQVQGFELEKSIGETIARKVNGWGDALLEPIRGNYGGRSYIVTVSQVEVAINSADGKKKETVSLMDKVRSFVGNLLKKLALLNGELDQEYKAVLSGDKTHFFSKINKSELSKAEGRGCGRPTLVEVIGECCIGCCTLICVMCEAINKH